MKFYSKAAALALAVVWLIVGPSGPAWAETEIPGKITLDAAIVRALNADPGLRASAANVDAAEAGIHQAGVLPNPTLGLEAENFAGSGPLSDFDGAEFTLSYQQRIERGGKRRARVGLAERETQVARTTARTARLNVIHAVQKAYAEVLAAEAGIENAGKRAQLAKELSDTVRSRVQVGRDPQAAEHRADVQEMTALTDLDQARRARDIAKTGLAGLWGSADILFDLDAGALVMLGGPEHTPLTDGPTGSPDLAILEAARDRADAAILLAKANRKQDPSVSIGVRQFQGTDDFAGVLGVSVPLPIFNTKRGNVEQANAEKRRAEWQLAAARRGLENRLATLGHTLRAAREEVVTLRDRLIPRAEQAGRLTREGYETGAFTYLEVLEAQRVVGDMRSRHVAALKTYHTTQADLDRLTERFAASLPGEEPEP